MDFEVTLDDNDMNVVCIGLTNVFEMDVSYSDFDDVVEMFIEARKEAQERIDNSISYYREKK